MIKKLKQLALSAAALSFLVFPALVPAAVSAQINVDCNGIQECLDNGSCSVDEGNCDAGGAGSKVNDIIKLVINIFSLIVGVIAVIMIIVGGLKYITSGGDSGNVSGAKNTIIYAVVGLVVVALAQFIVRFVLEKVSSGN
jgi:hypothetical protein